MSESKEFVEALEAMLVFGFPKENIVSAIRHIVKLYGGSWELIRDNKHQVVLDYLLDKDAEQSNKPEVGAFDRVSLKRKTAAPLFLSLRKQSPPNRSGSSSSSLRKPSPRPKRIQRVKTIKKTGSNDPGRNAAVKLGRNNDTANYLSLCRKKYEEIKKQAPVLNLAGSKETKSKNKEREHDPHQDVAAVELMTKNTISNSNSEKLGSSSSEMQLPPPPPVPPGFTPKRVSDVYPGFKFDNSPN